MLFMGAKGEEGGDLLCVVSMTRSRDLLYDSLWMVSMTIAHVQCRNHPQRTAQRPF